MYTLQQQVFALSLFSNAAENQTGTVSQLQASAKSIIDGWLTNPIATPHIGTSWQIVWGPVVVQEPDSTVADNVMVVYAGTSGGSPVYVVGVAATNGLSQFDIETEDEDVGSTVAFGNGGAWISQGTWDGVQNLKQMADPAGGALQQFLESKAAADATLIFAGHSLGGALAPTLALDLATQDGFDVTNWANVMVYPSAGLTPGNQLFSDFFAETFPQQQQAGTDAWNVWNMDVVNSLDIVPRCWSELATLPSLYPAVGSQEQANVQAIVTSLTAKNDLTTNVYATLPTSVFVGTYNPSPPVAPPVLDRPVVAPQYHNQARYQHIQAYINAIIPDLAALSQEGASSPPHS